jgi:hypothetical protein
MNFYCFFGSQGESLNLGSVGKGKKKLSRRFGDVLSFLIVPFDTNKTPISKLVMLSASSSSFPHAEPKNKLLW